MKKTFEQIVRIVNACHYKGWEFEVHLDSKDQLYLQLRWIDFDADNKHTLSQLSSRKWQLSYHMTKSEIVQTAFKAVLTAEEHETREKFQYKGKPVFGPHLDIDVLWEISGKTDKREST